MGKGGAGTISEQVAEFIPKMSHTDWQKRRDSAEAIIRILQSSEKPKLGYHCLSDLLNSLKVRIADPNKNIIKTFVQLTGIVFEIMPER